MDIRKPKPIHNMREFLKEVGIIVLGVSIALAAEQGMEWLHWRKEVATARAALLEEMAYNDNSPLARRIAYHDCMDRQVKEAEAIISDLEAGRPPRKYTALHTGVAQLFNDSEWQSQRASQVLTHFPHGEVTMMGQYYARLLDFRGWMENENPAWADLAVLRNPPAGLIGSDFLRLRASLNIARRINAITTTNAQRELHLGAKLGVVHVPVDPERVEKFCTLSDEGFAAYQRTLEPR